MRPCFIVSSLALGGAERVVMEAIDVLKERGVDCCALLPGDGEVAEELRKLGVPFTFVKRGAWVSWAKLSVWGRIKCCVGIALAAVEGMRRVRAWQCDVVCTNTFTMCYGSIAAWVLRLPHVWYLHEFGRREYGVSYAFGETLTKKVVGMMSSACIVVSDALGAHYKKFMPTSRLTVVYPSMHRAPASSDGDAVACTPLPMRAGIFRIVIVGGLVPGKGHADAIRALKHLADDSVPAELIVVGDGDPVYRMTLKTLALSVSVEPRVVFVGRVASALPYMRSSDVVVVCSRCEAFGRATVEGMLCGKAVVGARGGATPELVTEGFNGLLYESGNALDLATKLRLLHDDRRLLRRLGENGRCWAAANFTRARYAKELSAVLAAVPERATAGQRRRSALPRDTRPTQPARCNRL